MTVAPAALPNYEHYEQGKQLATLDGDLGSVVAGRGASLVALQDAGGFFPGVINGVEGALAKLGANLQVASFGGAAGAALAPGSALVDTMGTKVVTGLLDTVATAVLTITVPNAQHAAIVDLEFCAILGAGGAIGAGEATRISKYQLILARTAGVNLVATLTAAIGGAEAHVAGATSIATAVATLQAVAGAVGVANTVAILLAITKTGGASTNHVAVVRYNILGQNAGVTIA